MGNGEWGMGNGESGVGSRESGVGSREWVYPERSRRGLIWFVVTTLYKSNATGLDMSHREW